MSNMFRLMLVRGYALLVLRLLEAERLRVSPADLNALDVLIRQDRMVCDDNRAHPDLVAWVRGIQARSGNWFDGVDVVAPDGPVLPRPVLPRLGAAVAGALRGDAA